MTETRRWTTERALPEYSIESLTCNFADRFDVVMVGLPGAAQDRLLAHMPGARHGRPGVPRWRAKDAELPVLGMRTRSCGGTSAGCGVRPISNA
jgi:hypothetical protein